jgi:polyvinyl alcohol dehydrogenase (cytochrome)
MKTRIGRRAVVGALAAGAIFAAGSAIGVAPATRTYVFASEGNRLHAWDTVTHARQTVIPSAADDPVNGRDINAQICFTQVDGDTYFIAGEDTGQNGEGEPGWGWFLLDASDPDQLAAVQLGKLVPTWSNTSSNPENYGCGFLPDGRLVTTDVGDQLPTEGATGQLIVWFPDALGGYFDDPDDQSVDANYCKIDTSIATAGGVWVHNGWVYAAANRPGPNGLGGIYRYEIADLPTNATCRGQSRDADLVDLGLVTRQNWLPADAFVLTPSAIAPSGRTVLGKPTWYVSSVLTGVIAEYVDLGLARAHVRNVVQPPGGLPIGMLDYVDELAAITADIDDALPQDLPDLADVPLNDGGTPYGIGVEPGGTLWYADLGVVGTGPVDGHGSVQKVEFGALGSKVRTVVDEGLDYADGIGIVTVAVGVAPTPPPGVGTSISSEWGCPSWGMYGRGLARQFSSECPTPINPNTVVTLVPKWFVQTDRTVTASPVVVDGVLFVGDWSGIMRAVDAETGAVRWATQVAAAPGAAFGPIVSSAAVADVRIHGTLRRLVVFGAGPRVYALDANSGAQVWVHEIRGPGDQPLPADTPVEVESSPAIYDGVVYVGMDNHNTGGTGVRGGLLALNAKTGERIWKFEPEEPGIDEGCGGIWSSPVVDPSAGRVYVAGANCTRPELGWGPRVEAVTAVDMATGAPVWSFQPHPPNHDDHDFGATPNLYVDENGRRTLGAGNKDATYYALDPDTGSLRWSTRVAIPGRIQDDFAIGGFIGSPAVWRGNVYGGTAIGGPPYYHSIDGDTGTIRWYGAQAPSYAATSVINGLAFSAGLDSLLRAYDTNTGLLRWVTPVIGPASSAPAVVGDSVYIGSGTASSDVCAKDTPPVSELCFAALDASLGSVGGIHAFELLLH